MQRSSSVWLSLSKLSTLILCVLIFSTLSFAAAPDRIIGPIVSDRLIKLTAGVPMKAQPQFDRGPVDPSLKLGYMTLLTAPSATQQKAIDRLLAQQQDPHSPLYHKWLTPEQYAERFGLSPNDIQKLTAWLQSHGFAIISVARARNFIVFNGTAAQAESAFQTQIHNFEADGEKHFSNTTPISIPAALSGIVTGVRGLSNFRPKSHAHHAKLGVAKPDYTTSGGYLYIAPGDIATIYDLQPLYTAGIDGAGQTLAVMGQTDVYLADLNDFRSGFELPAISGCTTNPNLVITACDTTNFKYVLVNSDPGTPSTSDLPEADIDLEWSNAVARNAQIIYVNAPYRNGNGTWDSWYYAVDQDVAPVITLSYGLCELEEAYYGGSSGEGSFTSDEAELTEANLEGITFMNSSGDSGAAQCDYSESPAVYGYAVGYPASSPEVTGVGGTLIPYTDETSTYWSATNSTTGGSAISYIPEEAWNDEQEIGEFCVAYPTNSFCTGNGITSWETAQSAIGIWAGGGGLSNCVTETGGVCATPPTAGSRSRLGSRASASAILARRPRSASRPMSHYLRRSIGPAISSVPRLRKSGALAPPAVALPAERKESSMTRRSTAIRGEALRSRPQSLPVLSRCSINTSVPTDWVTSIRPSTPWLRLPPTAPSTRWKSAPMALTVLPERHPTNPRLYSAHLLAQMPGSSVSTPRTTTPPPAITW